MSTADMSRGSSEMLGGRGVESAPSDVFRDATSRPDSGSRISNEMIASSACGSAVEINYDEESRPLVVPFIAEWAFGSRPGGHVLNLSSGGRGLLAYSSAHAVVLYDYKTHSQRLLLGHRNLVTGMAADSTGSWLISVDGGGKVEPSCALLWNLTDMSLHRVLPGDPPEQGYHVAGLSADGRFAAAVAAGQGPRRLVYLWRCRDELSSRPDAVLELAEALGAARAVAFSEDSECVFMVTCDRNVAFLTWTGDPSGSRGALQLNVGQLMTKCPGWLVQSVFQRGTANAITVSTKGFVILWSDPPVHVPNAKVSRKVYCIERDGLTSITEVDGMVVIGTRRGHIRFYDQDMCLLHWYQQAELDAIIGLSFNLDCPAAPDLSWAERRCSFPTVRLSVDAEQRGVQERLDLSRLISGPSPRQLDAAEDDGEDPFQTRDLIVSTAGGCLVLVSFANKRCVLLHDHQDAITAIQTHTEKPQLLIGRANASISLIDYLKKEVLVSFTFEGKSRADPVAVTSLCYSPNGTVLACGRANGSLHLLHPVLLHPIAPQPFHKTRHAIQHLCFSPDSLFMAHCDSANFVSAYRCHNAAKGRWVYLGKKQLHALPVRNLLFGPQAFGAPLFSLGEDLVLVEYDVARSLNNTLLVRRLDRIEQSGVPSFITWCPGETDSDEDLTLLISTSEFKYKLVDLKTRQLCGTIQGPRLRTPISIIKTIGGAKAKAPATAVYATQRRLGLQSIPPDGNPYKNVAIVAHPIKILNFVFSPCNEFVFSCGPQDHSVIMWRINPEALDAINSEDDEASLQPWLLSAEGGRDGWLIRSLNDMFCYAQLLHQGAFSTEPRCITDRLALCELPDVMRAVGYFPSQFEINAMVNEVVRRYGESLSSSELVKLYVNYKPTHGTSLRHLRDAFAAFAQPAANGELAMTKERFLSVLLDKGEAMDMDEAQSVFRILLKDADAMDSEAEGLYGHLLMDEAARREKLFYFLPETITFGYLVDTLLGVVRK